MPATRARDGKPTIATTAEPAASTNAPSSAEPSERQACTAGGTAPAIHNTPP